MDLQEVLEQGRVHGLVPHGAVEAVLIREVVKATETVAMPVAEVVGEPAVEITAISVITEVVVPLLV